MTGTEFVFSILCVAMSVAAQEAELVPTHVEVDPIKPVLGEDGKIDTMAMDREGRLLLGVSRPIGRPGRGRVDRFGQDTGPREYAIQVLTPDGKLAATWPMKDVETKMIHACDDGTVYVGGEGALAIYDADGKQTKRVALGDVLNGDFKDAHVSGITACETHVFVAFGYGFSLRATEDIVRFDRKLGEPKLIVSRQFGCCSHIDLDVKGDVLLIAENSRHRVNRFTFDGELLERWGSRDRVSLEGFAACCNPVNMDFGPEGVLYTAESGIGRIKRYTPEGKFLGLVGYVDTTKFDRGSRLAAMSCYIPVEVSKDGKLVFVMDVRANIVRVLREKDDASNR